MTAQKFHVVREGTGESVMTFTYDPEANGSMVHLKTSTGEDLGCFNGHPGSSHPVPQPESMRQPPQDAQAVEQTQEGQRVLREQLELKLASMSNSELEQFAANEKILLPMTVTSREETIAFILDALDQRPAPAVPAAEPAPL